jgi:hypothetical protein
MKIMGVILGLVICLIIDAYCLGISPKKWFRKDKRGKPLG